MFPCLFLLFFDFSLSFLYLSRTETVRLLLGSSVQRSYTLVAQPLPTLTTSTVQSAL